MPSFARPPRLQKASGEVRRVGFEYEFSGIDVATAAEAVAKVFGGSPYAKSPARWQVESPRGDFKIEIDWQFLQQLAADQGEHANAEAWLDSLSQAASYVMPIEVVSPPLAMDQLAPLSQLMQTLREAGAQGTDESFIAAYGTHINPELPDHEPATLLHYMQAYALLQWWLVRAHDVDKTRRMSPYIDLYPETFVMQLLAYEEVSVAQLIDDYLTANPTRNRALDMLPLMSELDAERVRRQVDDSKIKARPTLHYRLPNCRINESGWSLQTDWQIWCQVEQLASRPKALRELAEAFRAADRPVLGVARQPWITKVDLWLKENLA